MKGAIFMKANISPSEWEIMRVAWSQQAVTSKEIFEILETKMDWKMSTVKTLVRRLTDKGYLSAEKDGRQFIYKPLIDQDLAHHTAGENFLDQVCNRKVGSILTGLVKDHELSKADLNQLIQVAKDKLNEAPDQVACHCTPGQCTCKECRNQLSPSNA